MTEQNVVKPFDTEGLSQNEECLNYIEIKPQPNSSEEDIKDPIEVTDERRPFKCKLCDKVFRGEQSIGTHMENHVKRSTNKK